VNAQPQRRGLLVPAVAALAAFVVLIGLGTWQLQRKSWKEELIDSLTRRATAAPVPLPAKAQWATLSPAHDEFRHVTFHAEFIHTQEAFVYTVGSSLRPDVSGLGFWVFTPARMQDGGLVVVNRGFIPQDKLDSHTRQEGQVLEAVDIVGVLRWPEARGWFAPKDDPASDIWYTRNHLAIAVAKGWGEVAPFFVDQEAPPPPGGFPKVAPLAIQLRNEHLQYAITWFGLAAVLVFAFTFWARSYR
jgi:surfeit locus 1 family protein